MVQSREAWRRKAFAEMTDLALGKAGRGGHPAWRRGGVTAGLSPALLATLIATIIVLGGALAAAIYLLSVLGD